MAASPLGFRDRLSLAVQREVGRLLGPIWIPLVAAVMRFWFGWRIEGARETRAEFRRIWRESSSPLLICANHLTMVDSFLIAAALGSPGWFVTHYASLPWNTPARENFAHTPLLRAATYVAKCIPVSRGGDRGEVGRVISRITWLLGTGQAALIFPEGGRSRKGRVDTEAVTYGVGRMIKAFPDCRVLCVYLRGERQEGFTALPAPGERFRVRLEAMEPKSSRGGLRGSLELSGQILRRLADMEQRHFDARQ